MDLPGSGDAGAANFSAHRKKNIKELSFCELPKIAVNHYPDSSKQEILPQQYNSSRSSLKDHPLFDAREKCARKTRPSLENKQKRGTLVIS